MQGHRKIDAFRVGVVVVLSVGIAALWTMAIYVTYQDRQRIRLEEAIVHPGAVSYGTHSVVTVPMLPSQTRHSSVPVISGHEVWQHAHSGHSATPEIRSDKALYATSSVTVKSLGSGIGANGSSPTSGHPSSASTRGIQYSTTTVSIPLLAQTSSLATSMRTTNAVNNVGASARAGVRPRTAMPGYDGEDGDWINGGSGDWWYYDEDHWRNPYDGETRFDPTLGYVVTWNGSEWVKLTEYDPGVPIGEIPWVWVLFLIGIICLIKKKAVLLHAN